MNLKRGTIQKSSQRIAHWLPGTRRRLGSTIPAAVCDIEGTICKEVPTETEHPTEMPEMGKILLFFPKAKRMRWIQAMWERLLSQRMLLHWRDNNALSLSVLPVVHLSPKRWTTGSTRKDKPVVPLFYSRTTVSSRTTTQGFPVVLDEAVIMNVWRTFPTCLSHVCCSTVSLRTTTQGHPVVLE